MRPLSLDSIGGIGFSGTRAKRPRPRVFVAGDSGGEGFGGGGFGAEGFETGADDSTRGIDARGKGCKYIADDHLLPVIEGIFRSLLEITEMLAQGQGLDS